MDILWSLGLIVILLVALNNMAGGRASSVLRPVAGMVTRLLSMVARAGLNLVGIVFKFSVGTIKLPKSKGGREAGRGAGPPPSRWKD
ncbi:MAG: hypothetical protein WCT03_00255 [Candidatus Obscuribacterales bacterium]